MEIEILQSLIATPADLIKAVQDERVKSVSDIANYQNQYNPKKHEITDTSNRQDKVVETDNGPSVVKVARLPVPMQKRIVRMAAAFLAGNPIKLTANPADEAETGFYEAVKRVWKDNKLDFETKTLLKICMAETEVAEIWYQEAITEGYWKGSVLDKPAVKFRLRMKVVANKFGDALYPVYNNGGDLIAFGRGYKVKIQGKEVERFDLYTEKTVYEYTKGEADWVMNPATNPFGKIPVVYYDQEIPEWSDVQEMIARLEYSLSGHADTNDYNGSPLLAVSGAVKGWGKKGEKGQVVELEDGAELKYVSWDNAPESVKLEQNNLRSLIHDMSSTPDISMENMKSLGVFSGIALKMLFLDAHMKAADKEETFGKSIQRRINFLKRAIATIDPSLEALEPLLIEPKFEYFLPKNEAEMIDMLSTATGGKATISQESAIAHNPLVADPVTELDKMKAEGLDDQNNI